MIGVIGEPGTGLRPLLLLQAVKNVCVLIRLKEHSSPGIVHDCMYSLVFGTTVIEGAEFYSNTTDGNYLWGDYCHGHYCSVQFCLSMDTYQLSFLVN